VTGPTDPDAPFADPAGPVGPAAGTAAGVGALAAGAAVALLTARAGPAAADAPSDIAMAQTAAAVETTVIAAYGQVGQLASVQALAPPAGTTLAAMLARTLKHHGDHLTAFNAAAVRLGGKAQTAPDAALATTVVRPALAATTSALDAVTLLAKLELIAAQTYSAMVSAASDPQLRASLASVCGVEAQHQAVLLAIAALLNVNSLELITFPLDASTLPATMPSDSTPGAFIRTDQARPTSEGAIK